METINSLREKLSDIISSGHSGIAALCGIPILPSGDDPFWENHEALVYIKPLDTVVAYMSWGCAYQKSSDAMSGDWFFQNFIDRDDDLTLGDLGIKEEDYLSICTDCLLNDMAHDETECPELDCEDYGKSYEYATDGDMYFPDTDFTITGAPDLAGDIAAIRNAAENGDSFTIKMPDGAEREFRVSVDEDGVYSLSKMEPDSIRDENTGEQMLVLTRVRLLRALDWRTLYAKSRYFIFLNWFCNGQCQTN